MSSFLPIALWGDSAEFIHKDSLHLLMFTVMSGLCRRRFWICGFSKRQLCRCGCFGRHTYDSIWVVIAWMFRVLLSQRHPSKDHRNRPFPAGSARAKKGQTTSELRWGLHCPEGRLAVVQGGAGHAGLEGRGSAEACVLEVPGGDPGAQLLRLQHAGSLEADNGHHGRFLVPGPRAIH